MPIIALGGLLNFIAIAANGGVMPTAPGRGRVASRAPRPRASSSTRACSTTRSCSSSATSSPRPTSLPLHNVFSIGDVHPADRRLRARARRLRLAARPAPLRRAPAVRLMFRAALSGAPARRFFAAHAQSCLGTGLAYVALPLLAYDRFEHAVGDRRGPAARPAAGDRPRPAARRAGRPDRLAHLRRRRRRPALPRVRGRDDRGLAAGDDRRRVRGRHRHRAVHARRAGRPAAPGRRRRRAAPPAWACSARSTTSA